MGQRDNTGWSASGGAYVCLARRALLVGGLLTVSLCLVGAPSVCGQQAGTSPSAGAVVVDSTVGVVNGDVILKSDVMWNLALDPSVRPDQFWNPRAQELMLRTLIDQRLLLQEAQKLPLLRPSSDEIQTYISDLAAKFNSAGDDPTRFERRQELVGLDRDRFEQIVRDRLLILKFVDFRFRSFVVVTEPEIVRYFETEEKPKLVDQSEGAVAAVLAARRDQIEKLLIEEKINESIEAFLEEAQARSEIVVFDGSGS